MKCKVWADLMKCNFCERPHWETCKPRPQRPRANAPNVLAGDRFTVGLSSVADSECDLQQLEVCYTLGELLRSECSWISGHPLDWIETWKPGYHHPSPFQLWTWENWAPSSSSNVAVLDLRMGSFARHIGRGDECETNESSKTKTSTHHVRNM